MVKLFPFIDVLKPSDGFAFNNIIWIILLHSAMILISWNPCTVATSIQNDKETEKFVTKIQIETDFFTTITPVSASPDVKKMKSDDFTPPLKTIVNTTEVLGTPAAYKLDIREPLIGCSLSEFACTNGNCIPSSKYCNRINDCDDNSDEPRFCTRKFFFCTHKIHSKSIINTMLQLFYAKLFSLDYFWLV